MIPIAKLQVTFNAKIACTIQKQNLQRWTSSKKLPKSLSTKAPSRLTFSFNKHFHYYFTIIRLVMVCSLHSKVTPAKYIPIHPQARHVKQNSSQKLQCLKFRTNKIRSFPKEQIKIAKILLVISIKPRSSLWQSTTNHKTNLEQKHENIINQKLTTANGPFWELRSGLWSFSVAFIDRTAVSRVCLQLHGGVGVGVCNLA